MNYFGMVFEKHCYFIADKEELLQTYADMIMAQMLSELLAYQIQDEGDQDDNS